MGRDPMTPALIQKNVDVTRFWMVKEEKFTTESKYPSLHIDRSITTKSRFLRYLYKEAMIAALRQRIQKLEKENNELKQQVEVLGGLLYQQEGRRCQP